MDEMSNKNKQINLDENALYLEYTKGVNPIRAGTIKSIPFKSFPSSIHESGKSGLHPLDISNDLGVTGPATSPGLCANFIRLLKNDNIKTNFNSSSELFYVIKGGGYTIFSDIKIPWKKGDFVVIPAEDEVTHYGQDEESSLYLIHDQPLLDYLGAKASIKKFKPVLFTNERSLKQLEKARNEGNAVNRSRISVILVNKAMDQTLTVSHTMWAMLGVLPKDANQLPHRHQSVALDLILDCKSGCYTLVGEKIDQEGNIINPTREEWQPNSVFITPPGLWHAHFNESGEDVNFIPIQDAGLQIYLRTLDIKFVLPNQPIPSV